MRTRWCVWLVVWIAGTCGCGQGGNTVAVEEEAFSPIEPIRGETVPIPGGSFMMGSDDFAEAESPPHPVAVNPFRMDKFEITNRQYAAYLNAIQRVVDAEGNELVDIGDRDLQLGFTVNGLEILNPEAADHPVVEVSWYGAVAYCEWAGGRLPTEAEWEYAARGTDGRHYPWANDPLDIGLLFDWSTAGPTAAVGSHKEDVSFFGVSDMGGNVAEWVLDWYDQHYYKISPQDNPRGPEMGIGRTARGGATSPRPRDMRVTVRRRYSPGVTGRSVGFRWVYDP